MDCHLSPLNLYRSWPQHFICNSLINRPRIVLNRLINLDHGPLPPSPHLMRTQRLPSSTSNHEAHPTRRMPHHISNRSGAHTSPHLVKCTRHHPNHGRPQLHRCMPHLRSRTPTNLAFTKVFSSHRQTSRPGMELISTWSWLLQAHCKLSSLNTKSTEDEQILDRSLIITIKTLTYQYNSM